MPVLVRLRLRTAEADATVVALRRAIGQRWSTSGVSTHIMSSMPATTIRDQTFAVIDELTSDLHEAEDSKALYGLLAERKDELGGESAIPAEDDRLSHQIRSEAAKRSREVSALRQMASSNRFNADPGRPIPLWLWLAWVVAIAAVIAAWHLFG